MLAYLGKYFPKMPSLLSASIETVDPESIVLAHSGDSYQLVTGAVEALGGMGRFVKPGDSVLIKPNASFNFEPERATTTNPEVASAVINLCYEAGASEVILADRVIHTPTSRTVVTNGLKAAAENAGAEFRVLDAFREFQEVPIEGSQVLDDVYVSNLCIDSDVLINLPIFKHHIATGSTIGMKSMMGLIWDRQEFHRRGLEECIADVGLVIQPDLTIVDVTRALMTGGPDGPGEVIEPGQVIAGTDPVAVDVAALSIGDSLGYRDFQLDGVRNRYINLGIELGLGDGDPDSVASKTVIVDTSGVQVETPTVIDNTGTQTSTGVPDWLPFASISAVTALAGVAAMFYSKRRERVGQGEGS
jgi:uncharacterized protein (DUF362 family)